MTKKATVTIDDQEYDAITGLPVISATSSARPEPQVAKASVKSTPSANLHQTTQRSLTLSRKFTKRPQSHADIIKRQPAIAHSQKTAATQHTQVHKFAPQPTPKARVMDIGPIAHPHTIKAHARSTAKSDAIFQPVHTKASTVKEQSLSAAIAKAAPAKKRQKSRFWSFKNRQVASIMSGTFALVLLAGYFTYINMPNLSVRIAAAQAGVDAAYPAYRPDGYGLNGPITYDNGRVTIGFKANAGNTGFKINQAKSGWDSDAVLDNYITPRAGGNYMPYSERGLTIYTYGNNAAWVNGGILYTIEGDAPLSGEQIRRIATSLL